MAVTLVLLMVGAVSAQAQGPAKAPSPNDRETKTLNLSAYAELLRSDVRALKVAIITEVMGFTEAEDKAFWPIYREYDREMAKLGDERVAMIAEYASNYSKLTDAIAEKLASQALDLEARRQAVKAKWCKTDSGRALAADSPARPPGRAPAVAADRSADRGCAAHRPVREESTR